MNPGKLTQGYCLPFNILIKKLHLFMNFLTCVFCFVVLSLEVVHIHVPWINNNPHGSSNMQAYVLITS